MLADRLPGIRPRPSVWRMLDVAARFSFPAATTALMLLVMAAPLGIPGQAELRMAMTLSCVFFWSLFRPSAMPPGVVFPLGLLSDLLGTAPPGIGVLTLLLVHALAARWRRELVRRGFLMVWLAFVAVAAGASALGWALAALLMFRLVPPSPGIFLAGLSAGVYPLLAMLLTRGHQTLAEPDRA